jgi:hypothetical protein
LLAQAHPKLAEAYLDVWYVAHDPQAAELDRRIAAAWLERMTLVMEAIAAPAPVECRKAA